jgi:hypothetical protein
MPPILYTKKTKTLSEHLLGAINSLNGINLKERNFSFWKFCRSLSVKIIESKLKKQFSKVRNSWSIVHQIDTADGSLMGLGLLVGHGFRMPLT